MAEGVGFEPTRTFALPVFKTGAINRSTTPPEVRLPILASDQRSASLPRSCAIRALDSASMFMRTCLMMSKRNLLISQAPVGGLGLSRIPWMQKAPAPTRGRGASGNPANRFEALHVEARSCRAGRGGGTAAVAQRNSIRDLTKTIIARNNSPDISFETSLNPYRGCEHGCIYCFARPTHEYLGFSAGLDFESKIMVKDKRRRAARGGIVLAQVEAADRGHERRDRSLSTGRTAAENHARLSGSAGEISQPSRDHHQESPRHARH